MPVCDEPFGFKGNGCGVFLLLIVYCYTGALAACSMLLLRWEFWGSRVSGRRWRIVPDDDARREADGFVLSGSGHEVLQHRNICEQ